MCEIYLSPIQDNIVRGTLTRKGITFLDIEVELMDQPPGMDPKGMIENMPLYNVKIIPDVANNTTPALRQLTQTNLIWESISIKLGAKTNYIETKPSKFDICHEVLKDANKLLGGFYVQCDQTLPNGKVLE